MPSIKKIEHNIMSAIKKTQYGGDVVMFLLNKIIKNVGLAHGFKTMCTWFAHGFYAHGFKTMHIRNKCRREKNLIWGRCCNLPN